MTPKLRFPGFTDEWQTHKLKDLIDLIVDNRGKTPPVITKGIPLIETNSLGRRRVNYGAVKKYVTEKTFNSWFRKHLKENDVLFSTVGQTGIMALYDDSTKAGIAQNIIGLRANEQTSGDFLYYLLSERRNNNKFKQIEMIAVQPSVKVSQMIHLKFRIPTISEQKKIADFLTAVDKKIETIDKKVELLKQYKKGVMQKIFTQQIRFKDESGNLYPKWENMTLGNTLIFARNGLTLKQNSVKNGYKVSRIETISLGRIDPEKVGYLETSKDISDYKLMVGDLLFSNINSPQQIGRIVYVEKDYDIYHGMNLLCLRANKGNCAKYLYYLLSSRTYKQYFESICNKAVNQASINQTDLKKTKIVLPVIAEQKKIADFLSSIDEKIQLEETRLKQAKKFKKSLIQRMFV